MKEKKNDKRIYFIFILFITLILYYGIRRNEENNEKILEDDINEERPVNKKRNEQIEDDIHLNNSKLLNIKVDVNEIKKNIIDEQNEKENNENKNTKNLEIELWKIETFVLSLFCVLFGGLYFYSIEKNNNLNDSYEKDYKRIKDNNEFDDPEMEYLINKEYYEI